MLLVPSEGMKIALDYKPSYDVQNCVYTFTQASGYLKICLWNKRSRIFVWRWRLYQVKWSCHWWFLR